MKNVEETNPMSKAITLIFPHQLFREGAHLNPKRETYLIEEFLFFKQYKFHKQKIAFQRASMKCYQAFLEGKGYRVHYIDSSHPLSDIRNFNREISRQKIKSISVIDPTDFWLEKRMRKMAETIELTIYENPLFLNKRSDLNPFFRADKKSFFQTTFYKQQRKKLNILLDAEQKPIGGKWTYDSENRKKYPRGKTPPNIYFPPRTKYWQEAVSYTNEHFAHCPGAIEEEPIYPIKHEQAKDWLLQFLEHRFFDFGVYEDAIVQNEVFLNHSVLSPLLNTGLLTPQEVLNQSLLFAEKNNIPINSTEGFVRQIIGWREFIRGMYECKGVYSRTQNFWNFQRKIPAAFYDGTTGIAPIDHTIKGVLKTGYCHHIERLMVLGNFMFLCEFDPDEVYKWFMELFIDAYDWVMVPNVYGMSQFADGGTFATKPYISGSNYLKKMSNYPKGEWETVWDALFWTFVAKNTAFFKSNPRTSMLLFNYNKMADEKKEQLQRNRDRFFTSEMFQS